MGAFISNGGEVQLELAYLSGLDRFFDEGFALGDPAQYLHPPDHPHTRVPQFHACPGCCPPVHGVVSLLSCDPDSGIVHTLLPQRLRGMRDDESEDLSWARVHGGRNLRKELLSAALHCGKSVDVFPEAPASAFDPQLQQQQRLQEFYAEMNPDPQLHNMFAPDEYWYESARSPNCSPFMRHERGSTSGAATSAAAFDSTQSLDSRLASISPGDSPSRGKRKLHEAGSSSRSSGGSPLGGRSPRKNRSQSLQ